jgi:multidrug transporter EmrE-like cation transporter
MILMIQFMAVMARGKKKYYYPMEPCLKNIAIILISVLLNASAQVLMRQGMLKIGETAVAGQAFFRILPVIAANIFLWLAFFCYGISIVLWMIVLSRVEVSFAYAFSSLGFVLVTVLGYIFLKEHISVIRAIGIAIVCAGIILVARS